MNVFQKELHRDNGPAYINIDYISDQKYGTEKWYNNGKRTKIIYYDIFLFIRILYYGNGKLIGTLFIHDDNVCFIPNNQQYDVHDIFKSNN